jgi:ABC-type transport system substrate-binding protein
METQDLTRRTMRGLHRCELLQAGLAAAGVMSTWPLATPSPLCGAEPGPPKHGGILRVRGWDPPHFDPHLTIASFTHWTLSFVYSRMVRHKVGTDVQPGTFIVEPDLAERWEALDDTTCVLTTYAKGSSGIINHPSTAASWCPRMSNSPLTAS